MFVPLHLAWSHLASVTHLPGNTSLLLSNQGSQQWSELYCFYCGDIEDGTQEVAPLRGITGTLTLWYQHSQVKHGAGKEHLSLAGEEPGQLCLAVLQEAQSWWVVREVVPNAVVPQNWMLVIMRLLKPFWHLHYFILLRMGMGMPHCIYGCWRIICQWSPSVMCFGEQSQVQA